MKAHSMKSKQCKICLYTSNHPFGINFNEEGICSGCQFHFEKEKIAWPERELDLVNILKKYRSKKGYHDCIIHVDGSAQSYYIVHLAKNILKLNPLLINYNSHYHSDIGIKNISQLITSFDCNFYQFTCNPKEYKSIVKHSLQKYKNIYWPYLAGRSSLPYRLSIKKKIPLIIHGGLQANEQVGMFSHYDNVEYSRWYRSEHELAGIDETTFVSASDTIDQQFFESISFPSDNDLLNNGIRGIFLSNYFKWDPSKQNIKMLKYKFTPQKNNVSFDSFENAGCSVYFGIHDILRSNNCDFIKSREHLSREIRFKRIDKKYAQLAYKKYVTNHSIKDINYFFDWLNIDERSKKWIFKHFFKNNLNIISKEKNINLSGVDKKYFSKSKKSKELFKLFGKGI